MNRTGKIALLIAHPASVIAAAWAVLHLGTPHPFGPHTLPVWPGISAPSGVYFIGVTLVLRDLVQRHIGKAAAFGLILVGAALAAIFSPAVALASGVAFLCSETVDFAVYTWVERFGELRAVLASNAVSIVIDSVAFLFIAFGSLAYMQGQVIGKALATIAAVLFLAALKLRHHRRAVRA